MITGVLLVIIQKFDRVLCSNQTFIKVEYTRNCSKTFEILCIKCYKSISMNNLISLETLNTIK